MKLLFILIAAGVGWLLADFGASGALLVLLVVGGLAWLAIRD